MYSTDRRTGDGAPGWIATALVTAFSFLFATSKIHNFDVWWHLRTGEWILENRTVPSLDPFSFTTAGDSWVAHYWLSDVLFALVHRAAGVDGLIILCALVVAAAFAVLHRVMVRRGIDPFLAAGLLGVAVVAARFRFMARPHVFMFLFAAIFLAVLDSDTRRRPRRLLWLLPVMLLWVNMHASFVLALVFTGALFAERTALWALRRRGPEDAPEPFPAWIGGVLLGLIVLTLASPFGTALPAWVLRDFTSHAVTRSFELQEHMALAWGERPLVWGLLFAALASFGIAGRRSRISDVLVAASLAVLGLRSVRFAALASMVFAVSIGTNLAPWFRTLLGRRAAWTWTPLKSAVGTAALVLAGLLAFRATYTPDKVFQFGLGVVESRYPTAATAYLKDLDVRGNVVNTWEFGGYLLWFAPGLKTFADGRTLDGHMDAVEKTRVMAAAELVAYVQANDVQAVVVKRGDEPWGGFASSSPLFRAVFLDDQAGVYLRRDLFDRLAQEGRVQDFRWIRPDAWDVAYLDTLAVGDDAEEVEAELRRAVSLSPGGFQPAYLLGCFLQAQGRVEALDAFEAAAAANPSLAFTHYRLGLRAARFALSVQAWDRAAAMIERALPFSADGESYFILGTAAQMAGRPGDAERAFQNALKEDPGNPNTLVNLGFLYVDSQRPELAIQTFTAALQADLNSENALYGLALANQNTGASSRSAELWHAFLERFPDSRWAPNARRFLEQTGVPPDL
ncbi:MAG TPA: tetratricopeptide repeat protein [Longimicrobiales bacterium]|nr:tetratricopeptide repeat protein [Longimicrobiales bacterium]